VFEVPQTPELPGFVTVHTGPPAIETIGPVVAIIIMAVLAVILLLPLVRAWARRIESRGADAGLRAELDELRGRLAEVEQHHVQVAELEERLDFAERLLAQHRVSDRIGPA
jgi:membrane protein implicated in regulation of membrane protease activity